MTDENVKANVLSVGELFEGKESAKLRIPAYQRDYAWTATDVEALCRDILVAFSAKRREYPIGTLVLHENHEGGDWLDIVDGQQRLSTICMLSDRRHALSVESGNSDFGKLGKEKAEELRLEIKKKIGEDSLEKVRAYIPQCTFVRIIVKDVEEAFQLFDTQNGRGKPLTAANLLKAYHFHEMNRGGIGNRAEVGRERQCELEGMWEGIDKEEEWGMNGPLLAPLLEQHLFRLRRWCRGDEAFYTEFRKEQHIGEFKGVTLGDGDGVAPCHTGAFLKRFFRQQYKNSGLTLVGMPSRMGEGRRDPPSLDPFESITQPIVNGEDFFLYVTTFATAHKMLFGDAVVSGLQEFKEFYRENCLGYDKCGQWTGKYSRQVFESLCLLLFDRYGIEGLVAHHRLMYRCAYWECSRRAWTWRHTPGQAFAARVARAMVANETLAELSDAFAKIGTELDQLCDNVPCNGNGYHLPKKQRDIVDGKFETEIIEEPGI
jgi:hypothetical protein